LFREKRADVDGKGARSRRFMAALADDALYGRAFREHAARTVAY